MDSAQIYPLVEIVVLNWNGGAYLPNCLDALQRQDYPHFNVTLVDNGSTDGSVAWVRKHAPQVTIIENKANLGFAAGNNVALRATSADIIALLNPDVVVSPGWLSQLVKALSADNQAGILGSKLWYPDGRTIQHGGGYLRPSQAMPGHYAIGEKDTGQADKPRQVDYVIGAALAMRREVLEQIGLFDEGFFLYFEDVDLCERAHRAGWRVLYEPGATAVHVESATAVKNSFAYLQRFHTGRWRYILKHYPVDTILDETIAAETEWLARIDLKERMATALAYQSIVSGYDEVLVARTRQGTGTLTPEIADEVRSQLVWLRDISLVPNDWPPRAVEIGGDSPEQAMAEAIDALAELSPAHGISNNQPPESAAGILEVMALLRESSHAFGENFRYVSELQITHDSLLTDVRGLAQSSREVQLQLDELEALIAALGLRQPR